MARFVTAAVDLGAAPFVLAGTDGADVPAMLHTELPGWLGRRGFDPGRRALWAWADGGAAALQLCADDPGWARAGALFSPRLGSTPSPDADLSALADLPLGIWCALRDIFYEPVRGLVRQLPAPPEVTTWDDDGDPRVHWNDHAIGALTWLAGHLTPSG